MAVKQRSTRRPVTRRLAKSATIQTADQVPERLRRAIAADEMKRIFDQLPKLDVPKVTIPAPYVPPPPYAPTPEQVDRAGHRIQEIGWRLQALSTLIWQAMETTDMEVEQQMQLAAGVVRDCLCGASECASALLGEQLGALSVPAPLDTDGTYVNRRAREAS